MKTIQVTDEQYEFLLNLQKELLTQDNRVTRSPMFQVRSTHEVAAYSGCGETIWVKDGSLLREENEILEYLSDELGKSAASLMDKGWLWQSAKMEKLGWREIEVTSEERYSNAFLTEKACEAHIQRYRREYANPASYVSCGYGNPEWDSLREFLMTFKVENPQ